jgi:hypothetical protein
MAIVVHKLRNKSSTKKIITEYLKQAKSGAHKILKSFDSLHIVSLHARVNSGKSKKRLLIGTGKEFNRKVFFYVET